MISEAVHETRDLQNIAYILEDHSLFQPTSFKVLKGLENRGMLPCVHFLYNGKIKLLYFTAGKSQLSTLLPEMNDGAFLKVLASLLKVVSEVESNGFLSCSNLELDADKIFVDAMTWSVGLIYLPFSNRPGNVDRFEKELKTWLTKLIVSHPMLRTERVENLLILISDPTSSLHVLHQHVCKSCIGGEAVSEEMPEVQKQRPMQLISLDPAQPLQIKIVGPEFVLGRNPAAANGVISFNPAISRVHCRVIWKDASYYLEDLGSAHGTSVNGSPIYPDQLWKIKDGDVLRLADSNFKVQMQKE